jgi:hypothetical protein
VRYYNRPLYQYQPYGYTTYTTAYPHYAYNRNPTAQYAGQGAGYYYPSYYVPVSYPSQGYQAGTWSWGR